MPCRLDFAIFSPSDIAIDSQAACDVLPLRRTITFEFTESD